MIKTLIILINVFALSSCVTMTDLNKSLTQLEKNSIEKKVFNSSKQAAQLLHKNCIKPPINNKNHPNRIYPWKLDINHNDHIISQGKMTGYFKVLCLDLKDKAQKLHITGVHAGGGMGKAFFLLPKVTIFNNNWEKVQYILKNVKQNALTGNLEMYLDIKDLPAKMHYIIFEGDNRAEGNEIGEYLQGAYAIVPIIVPVKMYSLPVGKAKINIIR